MNNFENCDYCKYFNRERFWCKYYNQPIACNMNLVPLGCQECIEEMKKKNESKN